MDNLYDLIIIGAGPAGITAGIYASRKAMNFLIITKDIGGQAAWSGDIENYTGYQFITGPELAQKFEEHMRKYNIHVKENEEITGLEKKGNIIYVRGAQNEYRAKTVIIATGKRSRELGVPGEKEFKNKGVTYCATCDGPIFAGKETAVIGGGNSAMDAALQMINIAKHVYIIDTAKELSGDIVMREKVRQSAKATVFNNSRIIAVLGEKMVNRIKIQTPEGEKELPVEGIFVEIGLIPNSEFTGNLDKNELKEIKVNCANETNIPGIFAAGDVTDVPEKQIIIAAGEGSKALLTAFRYLSTTGG
ncbi:MAG: FAD-dependent oxidoreductase [Candidatus Omnitrophota bacterium]